MTVFNALIIACWLVFIAYWAYSAFSAKRNIRPRYGYFSGIAVRVGAAIVVILIVHFMLGGDISALSFKVSLNPFVECIGVLLCAFGIGLAVWARYYLGKNWGMPMSVKENPELVTSGPYARVRHPIYTGVLMAIFGSMLVAGLWWLMVFVAAAAYFTFSARMEEALMLRQFPDAYPAYKARTKMLIPYIL